MSQDDDSNSEDEHVISRKKKRITIDSDDSDNETNTEAKKNVLNDVQGDSNDDDDNESDSQASVVLNKTTTSTNNESGVSYEAEEKNDAESSVQSQKKKSIIYNKDLYDAEDSDEEGADSKVESRQSPVKNRIQYNKDLYDAEDSDEEGPDSKVESQESPVKNQNDADEFDEDGRWAGNKSSGQKNDPKKKKGKKPKEPSSADNMREIRRESQRMLRESHFILPYHIPKQRTLKEFLNRRKSGPSIPLKTTTEQLTVLSKQIEQLEKESEEFFKSDDSGNDDDGDEDYVPESESKKKNSDASSKTVEDDIELLESSKLDEDCDIPKEKIECSCDLLSDGQSSNVDCRLHQNSQTKQGSSSNVIDLLNDVADKLATECTSQSRTGNVEGAEESLGLENDSVSFLENKSIGDLQRDAAITRNSQSDSGFCNSDDNLITKNGKEVSLNDCLENLKVGKSTESENMAEDRLSSRKSSEQSSKNTSPVSDESKNMQADSEEYSFVLRMPEDSEKIVDELDNEDKFLKSNKCLNYSENSCDKITSDKEIDENSTEHLEYKDGKSVNKVLKNNFFPKIEVDLNKVPKLSGNANGEINLESPVKRKGGITDLKKRFFEHFALEKMRKVKAPVQISIVQAKVNKAGHVVDISKETINQGVKVEEEWLDDIKDAKLPGAKLSLLKAHLESQWKVKWKEEWDKRIQEHKLNEEEEMDEDGKSDYEHEALLDDEDEEAELTASSEDDDEDLEEDDVKLTDKKRVQSNFVEDEAEVSEDDEEGEEEGSNNENDEDEDEEDLLGNNGSGGENESDDEKENSDADDERFVAQQTLKKSKAKKKAKGKHSDDDDDDDAEEKCESEDRTGFISPVFRLTAIEGKSFSVEEEEDESQFLQQSLLSQTQDGIEKLLDKSTGTGELTQNALADICSGVFPSQPVAWSQFEGSDKKNSFRHMSSDVESQFVDESQDFSLTWPEDRERTKKSENKTEEKKRPNASFMDSSDDEDDDDANKDVLAWPSINRSKPKRVKYSDDEDEDEPEEGKESKNDDDDDDDEKEGSDEEVLDEIGNEEDEGDVDYDSEENEIVKDARGFFDKEAELSESEWGSEDEDEKDLDKFEAEAGDDEEIDQDKLNSELGKIHMQQMLVEDKREVRILQELLLEDGELHSDGNGRVRQFRWANADGDVGDAIVGIKDSDEDDSDQGEDEENWRKIRHERELFLQKKNAKLKELGVEDDDEEEGEEGESDGLLEVGRAALKKMQTVVKQVTTVTPRMGTRLSLNSTFFNGKRGSFLTSSDQYLSRLAHITSKVGSESKVNGPKNSRNFVFSIVSPKKEEEVEQPEPKKVKKRKADENAENTKKKIHFADQNGNTGQRKSLLEMLNS